ncbi:hypothetical protein Plhal304r1_c022g0076311 [Plasmopara halstedii]
MKCLHACGTEELSVFTCLNAVSIVFVPPSTTPAIQALWTSLFGLDEACHIV